MDGLSFISRALAQTANTVIGAGAFVFDPNHDTDNDHHSNMEVQKGKMNLKVSWTIVSYKHFTFLSQMYFFLCLFHTYVTKTLSTTG